MKVKELIATILVVSMMNLACFIAGAKVGQKVSKDEPIEIPKVEPLKAYREYKEHKHEKQEQDRLTTIMQNIESYDGTSYGQKDVPRG